MTRPDASAAVSALTRGQTRRLHWEGPDAYCWLDLRYDVESGRYVGETTEFPFDVLSPFREGVQTWDAAGLIEHLQTFALEDLQDS